MAMTKAEKAAVDALKVELERAALLLEIVGKYLVTYQPEDAEFYYDGSRADAWGCGTDCLNAAVRAHDALRKITSPAGSPDRAS